MTPEQQDRYERDRAEAQAVYARLMMESNVAVIRARAPIEPANPESLPNWLRRVCRLVRASATTKGGDVSHG